MRWWLLWWWDSHLRKLLDRMQKGIYDCLQAWIKEQSIGGPKVVEKGSKQELVFICSTFKSLNAVSQWLSQRSLNRVWNSLRFLDFLDDAIYEQPLFLGFFGIIRGSSWFLQIHRDSMRLSAKIFSEGDFQKRHLKQLYYLI